MGSTYIDKGALSGIPVGIIWLDTVIEIENFMNQNANTIYIIIRGWICLKFSTQFGDNYLFLFFLNQF